MWWKRAAAIASVAVFGLAALSGAGCAEVPSKARSGTRPPQLSRKLEAADLLPVDLDIVVRIDIARLKAGLGPGVVGAFAERAATEGGDAFIAEAMSRADTVFVGLRLADLDAGDRVLVAEGQLGELHVDPSEWAETTPAATMEGVRILDRKGSISRGSTGRIVKAGDRLYAFVSPVEVDAVSRLLRDGADSERGDPEATGLVSADVRGHRLPRSLEKKYPSIAAVIAGVARIRGTAAMADNGVKMKVEIIARSEPDAARVEKFLVTVRDAGASTKHADLMKSVQIERAGPRVHVSALVPAPMVIAALSSPSPEPTPAR